MSIFPAGKLVWGLQLPIQSLTESKREPWELEGTVDDMICVAQAVEAGGGRFVGVCDHIAIPDNDYTRHMSAQWFDPISTLAFIAAKTTTVRLLSTVYIAPYRHPLLSAKQFMTLDRLSGGRTIIGVGAGHIEAEFEALGIDFAARGEQLNECIDAMRDAFANEHTKFTGKYFDYENVQLAPRPVQASMPIWIGGSSKPALRRVAERGDGWIPQGTPRAQMQEAVDYIRAHRDKVRPEASIDFGWLPEWIYVGEPFFEPTARHITGAPGKIAESLRYANALGCTALHLSFRARSAQEYCDQIAAFARDVWPSVIA
ncbi:MAG: TIGR03619 family F420-dependent LLM class oxidoreductase [Acidimicrobiales bacterium]